MQPTITLNKKKYKIAFNYLTLKELANVWDFEKPSQVEGKILSVMTKATPKKGEEPVELGFADIDILRDTFYAAITTVNNSVPFTNDEMMSMILTEPGALAEFTKHYINSLPKPKEEVDPNVRRDLKKK